MIRINLLPVREARKAAGLRKQVAILGIAACVGVVISIGVHANLASARSKQQRMISAARAELQELEKTRKEVERFRQEREEIERKLNVIQNLQTSREGPVRVMDEIATRIPARVWLTELTMDNGMLNMKGVSLDAEIVAAFLTSLSESSMISNVELAGTQLKEKDGLKLNTFEIGCRYAVAEPLSIEAQAGGAAPVAPQRKKN
jgi:type IV pilus assembly protein PilN